MKAVDEFCKFSDVNVYMFFVHYIGISDIMDCWILLSFNYNILIELYQSSVLITMFCIE